MHTPGAPVRIAHPGDVLTAPGVLALPVPVLALFDRDAAHETTLRNLLASQGYASLDAVRGIVIQKSRPGRRRASKRYV